MRLSRWVHDALASTLAQFKILLSTHTLAQNLTHSPMRLLETSCMYQGLCMIHDWLISAGMGYGSTADVVQATHNLAALQLPPLWIRLPKYGRFATLNF